MLVKADRRVPLARLLTFIERGEQLAHNCAQAQAKLAPESGMRTFLFSQARQEGYHAVSFKWAIGCLAPRHVGGVPFLKPFDLYSQRLHTALRRKDFAESLLAEQIILEALGEVLLKKIEGGLVKRNAPFKRLRHILLYQEEAHHAFGLRTLQRTIDRQEMRVEYLRDCAQEYLALADSMIISVGDLFNAVDEDPMEYLVDFHQHLPKWLWPNLQAESQQQLKNPQIQTYETGTLIQGPLDLGPRTLNFGEE